MADDFKFYASPDPVATNPAGVMTQGIGFPLRQVETQPAPVFSVEALRAFSFDTQNPTGLDAALQLNFGDVQTTDTFDLAANGDITCLVADEYSIRLRLQMGRIGSPGVAIMFMRALLNGTPLGNSVSTTLDDGNDVIPTTFTGVLDLAVNDVLTVEVYRDSAGIDAGGVVSQAASLVGWADSPSTTVVIGLVTAGELSP